MKCPRTKAQLKTVKVGGTPVYVSEACGGVFFENQDLKNFERPGDKKGDALVNHLLQFHNETLNELERVSCPKCPDTVMLRRYYSPLHAVEIDECPGCGGIWLDTGELHKLRSLFLDERERALLRAQMIEDTRPAKVEGLKHKYDGWPSRSSKVDSLFDIASYLTDGW